MSLPLTPSDSKEYQARHPIGPNDEFIVQMDRPHGEVFAELTKVFNKHGRGRVTAALTATFWVKDISWDIVNDLRKHPDIRSCGPVAKGPTFGI